MTEKINIEAAGSAEAIREISGMAKSSATPQSVSANPKADVNLVVLNGNVVNLKEHMPVLPARKRSSVTITDIRSFVDYVNDHKEEGTAIFFDVDALKCYALIDYHLRGENGKPAFCEHFATLNLKETDAWKAWFAKNSDWMTQVEFALFIEMMMADVVDPAAADILEISKGLEATGNLRFKSSVVLEDGNRSFVYDNQVEAKAPGSIEIPKAFELSIAPFLGAERSPITARFLYRVREGGLRLAYQLIRPQEFILAAVETAKASIEDGTKIKVYVGTKPTV